MKDLTLAGHWLPSLLLLLAMPRDAAAYIDPGTGSLIVQGLIAAFAASAVVVRGYWYRIKAFFRRDKDTTVPAEDSRQSGEPK